MTFARPPSTVLNPEGARTLPQTSLSDFSPDWADSPGSVLQAELDSRSMSQADLAARTGLSPKHVNQVIKGNASLSSDVAVRLQLALGIPSLVWGQLEASWQDWHSHQKIDKQIVAYTEWADEFPLAEMRRRGLPVPTGAIDVVRWLLEWFKVTDPDAFSDVCTAPMLSFRRAKQFTNDPVATAVWLRMAESRAERLTLQPWNPTKLRKHLRQLRACVSSTHLIAGFSHAQRIAADCGVAVIFVEEFHGTRASGATKWLAGYPMIALSSRHKKADTFWFTLFHELGHALHHPRRVTYIDFDGHDDDDSDGRETEADEFAVQTLLPEVHDAEIRATDPIDLPRLAERLGVDVGVIAGRRGYLMGEWNRVAQYRPPVDWAELERQST